MTIPIRTVLLAEKDHEQREMLAGTLRQEIDCIVIAVASAPKALEVMSSTPPCVLIVGFKLPGQEDGNLIAQTIRLLPQTVIVPVIPRGNRQVLCKTILSCALTYLNFPYDKSEAILVTDRALSFHELQRQQAKRGCATSRSDGYCGLIGQSPPMLDLFETIDLLARDGECTVLIQGESGTGKELVARAIHAKSHRFSKNFVPVNCASIPDELMESELFGYLKGAFTGAAHSKPGLLQFADGGTLFLDEIGDMPHGLQAKLLRVLQDKTFVPVGGLEPMTVDVRILSATNQQLEELVSAGKFREDLYYRLSVIPLRLPPLRDRPSDIPLLLDKFVQVCNHNRISQLLGLTPAARTALKVYPWPGNVRELENLVKRLVVLLGGGMVDLADLPPKYASVSEANCPSAMPHILPVVEFGLAGVDFTGLVHEFEGQLILKALTLSGGNKKEAARILHLNRTTLLEKLKKLALALPEEMSKEGHRGHP